MVAHDDDRDLAEALRAGYAAPPPPPAFVEQTRLRLGRELRAAQASRRRLLRIWRYVSAAAVIVAAGGLAAVGFRNTSCAPKETGTLPGPEAFSTPRRPVPLELQLPSPLFVCTPRFVRPTAHMEPYEPDAPRPPLFVPAGTRNLALGRPVTCSNAMGVVVGDLAQITDGAKSGLDNGVELLSADDGPTWVQIDLGQPRAIYAIAVWRSVWPTVFHDVIIQVSGDPAFRRGVHTLFNNDFDNSAGLGVGRDLEGVEDYRGRVIDAAGAVGRYVRLYSSGCLDGAFDRYVEVEVHGRPVTEAALDAPDSVPLDVKTPRPGALDHTAA